MSADLNGDGKKSAVFMLTADGSVLQNNPTNFKYRPGSKVEYTRDSGTSENKSVEFNTSSSVETLFCASNPKAVENAISEIRGKLSLVDGISSVVGQGLDIASDVTDLIGVGGDTLKKAKELNEKVGKTTGTLGGILTKLHQADRQCDEDQRGNRHQCYRHGHHDRNGRVERGRAVLH